MKVFVFTKKMMFIYAAAALAAIMIFAAGKNLLLVDDRMGDIIAKAEPDSSA